MKPRTDKTRLLASADSVELVISSPSSVSPSMKTKRRGRKINFISSFRRATDDLIHKGKNSPDNCETVFITSKLNSMNICRSEGSGPTVIENDVSAEVIHANELPSIGDAKVISRLPSIDQTVSSNSFFSSETFFKKTDFETSNWSETIQSPESLSLGFIGIMAATVVIHPILFVTGAATAVWAVGMLHAVEKGYHFFSHNQIQDLFWDDPEKPNAFTENLCNRPTTTITPKKNKRNITTVQSEDAIANTSLFNTSRSTIDTPTRLKLLPGKSHVRVMDDVIQGHFPPLAHTVVSEAEFPGLNALEFFDVFFADDAPYSFKDFQKTRGDIDIQYSSWDRISQELVSFLPESRLNDSTAKLPTCSQRERICKFKTLTNSYFGPAYANATKTQRVCKFSTRLVIIESKTELSEIPFSDRFYVIERWVIEAIKHHPSDPMIYTSTVSVNVEIILRRDCTWENQIRSKTISTMTSMILKWIESATKALQLTIQRKLERMRLPSDKSEISYRSEGVAHITTNPSDCASVSSHFLSSHQSEQALMSMHQRQLKLLEEKITTGDLEWCSIEMIHSKEAGAEQAFAEIINPTFHELHFSPEEDDRPLEIAIHKTKKRKSKRTLFTWRKK